MALVGKYTKYDVIDTGETEIQTIEYPLGAEKEGVIEEVEVPKSIVNETIYNNAYAVVHSINSWKNVTKDGTDTLFNITYRVYESKNHRINDYDLYILQEYTNAYSVDYSLEKTEIQQAYDILSITQGFEQLKRD
tara:strand:- start:1062 stop:1466 length:405 start_codon:yes stop_codon:yes gene_type:complete